MGTKAERRAARGLVASYHEARLAELVEHVDQALGRYRAGEVDVFEVDEALHRYHKAARELWKFCWGRGVGAHIELVARTLEDQAAAGEQIDWWAEAAPRR